MLSINILPQELKDDIKLMKLYSVVSRVAYLSLFFVIVLSCVSFLSREIIRIQSTAEMGKNENIERKNTSDTKLKDLKEELEQIKSIKRDSFNFTKEIDLIASYIDAGIVLSSINIDREKNMIMLSGEAKTREDLLSFKKKLESSEDFTDVNFPVKNLLEKQNIYFDVSMNIKFL